MTYGYGGHGIKHDKTLATAGSMVAGSGYDYQIIEVHNLTWPMTPNGQPCSNRAAGQQVQLSLFFCDLQHPVPVSVEDQKKNNWLGDI